MEELMKQRIWVLWRKEANGDRITKVPFAASGGATGTNEKYRHTWVTYDEAVEAAKRVGAAGVGFVIPEGYFFLDIDHADLNDPRVKTTLSRFDSYAEFSVSGNGVHPSGAVQCGAGRNQAAGRKVCQAPQKQGKLPVFRAAGVRDMRKALSEKGNYRRAGLDLPDVQLHGESGVSVQTNPGKHSH